MTFSTNLQVVDALIVGMDMIINNAQSEKKTTISKRIFMVTDAGCPVNKDSLTVVLDQFKKMEAKLNIMYDTLYLLLTTPAALIFLILSLTNQRKKFQKPRLRTKHF